MTYVYSQISLLHVLSLILSAPNGSRQIKQFLVDISIPSLMKSISLMKIFSVDVKNFDEGLKCRASFSLNI